MLFFSEFRYVFSCHLASCGPSASRNVCSRKVPESNDYHNLTDRSLPHPGPGCTVFGVRRGIICCWRPRRGHLGDISGTYWGDLETLSASYCVLLHTFVTAAHRISSSHGGPETARIARPKRARDTHVYSRAWTGSLTCICISTHAMGPRTPYTLSYS